MSHHLRWYLLLICAALTAPACSKSPNLGAPEKDLSAYSPFPGATAEQAEEGAQLEVTMSRPSDKVAETSVVSVAFNQGMVEASLGEKEAKEPPFRIEPHVDGEFHWMGSRTAVFHPAKSFPPATKFSVTVPAGTQSLSGAKLGQDHTFEFHTPFLVVEHVGHDRYGKLKPDERIIVDFNQPVRPSDFEDAVVLRRDGDEVAAEIDAGWKKDDQENRVYLVRAKGGFAFGSTYSLYVKGSLKPLDGNENLRTGLADQLERASRYQKRRLSKHLFGGDFRARFETYGDFAAEAVKCGYRGCSRWSQWRVQFSNPLDPKTADRCVSTSGIDLDRMRVSGDDIYLEPNHPKPGHTYTVRVSRNCQDIFGNHLPRDKTFRVEVDHDPAMVSIDEGLQILERGDASEPPAVPVTVKNVEQARTRMYAVPADKLAQMVVHVRDKIEVDAEPLSGQLGAPVTRMIGGDLKADQAKSYALDLRKALAKNGRSTSQTGAVFLDAYSRDVANRYNNGLRRSLVVVTDLGMTVKQSADKTLVWVTRLSTGEPVEGATVSTWNADGAKQWSGATDANGLVASPATGANAKPRVLMARKAGDVSVVDMNDWDGRVSPASVGVSYRSKTDPVAAENFIFTERGVYRAGETVHIKGYTRLRKDGELQKMPADRVVITVQDSRGENLAREEVALSELGGFSLDVDLRDQAPLGTYRVRVSPVDPKVDGHLAEGRGGSFRVEAYRTPEFEVLVEPDPKEMVVGRKATVDVLGKYLFGAPMRQAKARWSVRRTRGHFDPANFKDFEFGNQGWRYWWYYDASRSRQLVNGSGELDDQGRLQATVDVPKSEDFSGPQQLEIEASVTDVNRQQLSGRASIRVHPGQYYVGVHRPSYLVDASEPIAPEAVAVDHDGMPVVGKPVKLAVMRRKWKSVKKKAAGGGYTWETESVDTPVDHCNFRSQKTATKCTFDLPGPGSYLVQASSTDGLGNKLESITQFYAYGDGDYWWGRQYKETINLVTDADSYKVGQTAKIMVQSPFDKAKALVTVERGTVLEQFTTDIDQTTATIDIPVTEKMQPNAYVSVSLVRGRVAATAADKRQAKGDEPDPGRPAFKIGYAKLKVDHSDKILSVDVSPDSLEYRPGGLVRAEVNVADDQGQPTAAEVTFMAVDQGVLSLTGYQTPDPAAVFFANQFLGVENRDSRLMLTTRAELAQNKKEAGMKAAEGGDGGGSAMNYRSKFATTAAFESTVPVGADGKATVEFELPENLTAYRLMAVAVATDNRFGSGDKRVQVNKKLMARPALPRFAATGDTFEARVVVQAMGDYRGEVTVEASTDGPLTMTGKKKQSVTLTEGGNREVAFPVEAGAPGEATVRFSVRGEGAEDAVSMKLPIEYPAAEQTVVESGLLTMDSSWSQSDMRRRLELPDDIRHDVGGLEIELSSSAIGQLLPGLEYLVDYPYGCVEQVTGRTLPLVSMRETVGKLELPGLRGKDIAHFAQSGIDKLFSMQTRDGGLGYWPGAGRSHPWGSAYGALAVVRAKHEGEYRIDEAKYSKLIGYLNDLLRGEVKTPAYWPGHTLKASQAFAAWVLAEAGEAQPSYHTRLYDDRAQLPYSAMAMLAMAIHEAGDSAQMRDQLLSELTRQVVQDADGTAHIKPSPHPETWNWFWYSPRRADAALLMALLRIRPNDALIPKLARGLLVHRHGGHWRNTQETAFAVMALGEYFQRAEAMQPDYEALVGLGDEVVAREAFDQADLRPRRMFIPMKKLAKFDGKLLTIARRGAGGPMYYTATLSYVPNDPPETAFDGGFHLTRQYIAVDGDHAGEPIDKVRPGQVVEVRLALTVPEETNYVAVEDRLPAGFEPINLSFKTTSTRLRDKLDDVDGGDWQFHWWSYYWWMSFDYTAQHDDRVELFSDKMEPGLYRHAYLARATTPGEFTAPAARVEAMYEPLYFGRSDAADIRVR